MNELLDLLVYATFGVVKDIQKYTNAFRKKEITLHTVYPTKSEIIPLDYIYIGGIIDGGLYYKKVIKTQTKKK